MKDNVPEFASQVVVDSNSASQVSRAVTAQRRFYILALSHDGFEMRIYKSSSLKPIVLVSLPMFSVCANLPSFCSSQKPRLR